MAPFIITHRCTDRDGAPAFGGAGWHRSARDIALDLVTRRALYMLDRGGTLATLVVRRHRTEGTYYLAIDGETDPPKVLQSLPLQSADV